MEGGRLSPPAFKNWVCPFSPNPLFFKLSKGTSVSVVFSELYLTKSLLADEGPSEANPSKGIFGQERGKAHSARFGDSIFGDRSLYWTALLYNPISVPVKNILQDVKNISHIFLLSGRPLFKLKDHKFETLSKFRASAAIYRVGWSLDCFFLSFLGVS